MCSASASRPRWLRSPALLRSLVLDENATSSRPWRRSASPGVPALTLDDLHTWREVEEDPEPFLSLRLCSAAWLESALPALLEATERCVIAGDAFSHLDTRSDNICFVDGRAILVDWNWGGTANPLIDAAFWMPSLFAE